MTTRRLLAAAVLAGCTATAAAVPASIDLNTGSAWSIYYVDVEAMVGRTGPAFAYDCLGSASGPQCLSLTSTGYAGGTWLPGATETGFMGSWQAYVDFTLPSGATHVQLIYELLGVDDVAQLVISTNGNGLIVDTAVPGAALPAGAQTLDGVFGAPGAFRLTLEVENNPNYLDGGFPAPIGLDDGTAVVGRFKVSFDLPGDPNPDPNTVPVPGTLACAGLALATALAPRRRPPRAGVSRPCAGPR